MRCRRNLYMFVLLFALGAMTGFWKVDWCWSWACCWNDLAWWFLLVWSFQNVQSYKRKTSTHMTGKNKVSNLNVKVHGRVKTCSTELETELVNHLLTLESMYFGLWIDEVRKLAFDLAESNGIMHAFNKEVVWQKKSERTSALKIYVQHQRQNTFLLFEDVEQRYWKFWPRLHSRTTRIKRGWKETEETKVWKTSWEAVYETEEKDTRCCQRCSQEKTKQVDPHRSARVKPPRPISDQPPLPQKPTWLTYETQGWSGLYFISAGFSVMGQ